MSDEGPNALDPQALLRAWTDPREDALIELAADGGVIGWSEGAQRLLGHAPDEAIGRPLADLIAPAGSGAMLQRLLAEHGCCRRVELQHCSGEPIVLQWLGVPRAGGALVLLRNPGERARLAQRLSQQTAQLLSAEERFDKSFHGNPAGLAITRLRDSQILDCNRAFAHMLAFERSTLVGRKVTELNLYESGMRERLIEDLRAQRDPRVREIELRDRNGRQLSLLAAVDMIELEGEPCLLTMAVDQTERREVERALRQHELLLRETGEIAKVGGWNFEVQTGAGSWTDEVARIHEVDPRDPIWRERGESFFHGQDRERISQAVKSAIERAEGYDLELQIDTALGNRRWVRTIGQPVIEEGRVVRLRGSFQDITERKLGELRLRAQLSLSRALFESESLERAAPIAMRVLCELQEWQAAQLWQRPAPDVAPVITHAWPEGWQPTAAADAGLLEQALGSGQPCHRPPPAAADGVLREVCAVPLTAAGEVCGALQFFATDPLPLTPAALEALAAAGQQLGLFICQRESERALQRVNAELEQRVEERTAQLHASNRELEAFSYSVSHDLRAPLRTVGGFAQALHEDFGQELPPDAQRYLDAIRHGARQMSQLIEDLLSLSRLNRVPLRRKPVDMQALARTVLDELAPSYAGRVVHLQLDPLPECSGEPALLKQVWLNLLSNALKYTQKRAEAHVTIGFTHGAYFVRDDGSGFDPQYAHKLFGVFERLHAAHEFEGSGVGLAIVRRIVDRHGGNVWAEGQPERGACFYFNVPGPAS